MVDALLGGLNIPGLDLGAITGGLLGGSSASVTVSKCASDDTACKAAEDEQAAAAALANQRAEDEKYRENYYNLPRSTEFDLECSMDGFVELGVKFVELLLLLVSLIKELLALALEGEPQLAESLQLIWKGFLGGSTWMGYAMYVLYAVGTDYGFGQEVCDTYSYGWVAVKEAAVMVDFAKPLMEQVTDIAKGGEIDIGALAAAATDAASGVAGAVAGEEAAAAIADAAGAVTGLLPEASASQPEASASASADTESKE